MIPNDISRYIVIPYPTSCDITRYDISRYCIHIPKFLGRCSVTIFLTDLDGTGTQHDGNFLAVDGFPFFDGNVFGGRR